MSKESKLEDIVIESIQKLSLQDGDILIVKLPLDKDPLRDGNFRFMNTVNNEFETIFKKLGLECEVIVMSLDGNLQLEVVSKKELEI